MIHLFELNLIKNIKNLISCGMLDSFFLALNYLDTAWFLIFIVSIVYYIFNRKLGIELLLIFVVSGILNMILKNLFSLPRPCHLEPNIALLCHKSFGFPSGAAQTATILLGFGLNYFKKRIYKLLTISFAFLMYFSRVYLGMHFFSDILGGICVGLILLFLVFKIFPLFKNQYEKAFLALSLIIFLIGGSKLLASSSMLLGIALGLFLSKEHHLAHSLKARIIKACLICVITSSIFFLGEYCSAYKTLLTFIAGFVFINGKIPFMKPTARENF